MTFSAIKIFDGKIWRGNRSFVGPNRLFIAFRWFYDVVDDKPAEGRYCRFRHSADRDIPLCGRSHQPHPEKNAFEKNTKCDLPSTARSTAIKPSAAATGNMKYNCNPLHSSESHKGLVTITNAHGPNIPRNAIRNGPCHWHRIQFEVIKRGFICADQWFCWNCFGFRNDESRWAYYNVYSADGPLKFMRMGRWLLWRYCRAEKIRDWKRWDCAGQTMDHSLRFEPLSNGHVHTVTLSR